MIGYYTGTFLVWLWGKGAFYNFHSDLNLLIGLCFWWETFTSISSYVASPLSHERGLEEDKCSSAPLWDMFLVMFLPLETGSLLWRRFWFISQGLFFPLPAKAMGDLSQIFTMKIWRLSRSKAHESLRTPIKLEVFHFQDQLNISTSTNSSNLHLNK